MAADGSCWLYAVLAGLGQLEHGIAGKLGTKTPLPRPTLNDRNRDKQIRAMLFASGFLPDADDILRHPDYERERRVDQFLGSFGGAMHYSAMCRVLNISKIVEWDEVDDEDVLVADAHGVEFVSPLEAELLADDPLTVHIGYSRETDRHVEAYVRE